MFNLIQNFRVGWSTLPFKDKLAAVGSIAAWLSALFSLAIGIAAVFIAQSNKQIAENSSVFQKYDLVRASLLEFNRNSFRDEIKRGGPCVVALASLDTQDKNGVNRLQGLFETSDDNHFLQPAFLQVEFPAQALIDLKRCVGLSNDQIFDQTTDGIVKFHTKDYLKSKQINIDIDLIYGQIANDLGIYLDQWETILQYWTPKKDVVLVPRLAEFDGNRLITEQFPDLCNPKFSDNIVFTKGIRPNGKLLRQLPKLQQFLDNCEKQ